MPDLPEITLELFHEAATEYADYLVETPWPDLYGASDGKAVGTAVEARFKEFLQERFNLPVGNAARGIDFPSINLDLKVTSARQPQSSSPFRSATQKIYGLGYNLLVVVYIKRDVHEEQTAYLDIQNVIYIDMTRTGDYTLTKEIRSIIENVDGGAYSDEIAVEELDALLENKNVPLDDASRRALAERLLDDVPEQGVLTISNALQWRLQYARAISMATTGAIAPEVVDLRG